MVCECHSHVATWGIVHNEIEPRRALECEVETDDELVSGERKDVPFGAGVADQVLRQYLVLLKDFHRVELRRSFPFLAH